MVISTNNVGLRGLLGCLDFARIESRTADFSDCKKQCGCDNYVPDACGKECQPNCCCDNDCNCYSYDPNCGEE